MGRAIAGTYVRTYVRMCSCRHSARNCTHRAHWIQDAILQYTYVRSGPNRAGGFNEQKCSPAQLFRDVIFNVVLGHVEVQAKDYSAVSKMDARLQFLKPSVLIYKYMTEFDRKFPAGVNKGSKAFTGRKERITCAPIKSGMLAALDHDLRNAVDLEKGLKAIVANYHVNDTSDKVIKARARLFASFGELVLKMCDISKPLSASSAAIKLKSNRRTKSC